MPHRTIIRSQDIGPPDQEIGQPDQDIGQPDQDIGQPDQDTEPPNQDIEQSDEDIGTSETESIHKPIEIHFPPEILGEIFLYLPIRDLLVRIPLVCRAWKQILSESLRVQRKLFFKPISSIAGQAWADSKWDFNPFLSDVFPHGFASTPNFEIKIKPNVESVKMLVSDKERAQPQAGAYTRDEASWRRMLVVQPPCTVIIVLELEQSTGTVTGKRDEFPEYLTMEDLRLHVNCDGVDCAVLLPMIPSLLVAGKKFALQNDSQQDVRQIGFAFVKEKDSQLCDGYMILILDSSDKTRERRLYCQVDSDIRALLAQIPSPSII